MYLTIVSKSLVIQLRIRRSPVALFIVQGSETLITDVTVQNVDIIIAGPTVSVDSSPSAAHE
jgi:hypothetical protein